MIKKTNLSIFSSSTFNKEANFIKMTLWYFINALIVRASWNPFMGIKIVNDRYSVR